MSFLLFGSTWFWILFLIASIFVIVSTEKGSGVGATTTLVVSVALFYFFGNKIQLKNFFSYIVENPWGTVFTLLGYIAIGTGWAVLKWYFFLIKERDQCIEKRLTFMVAAPDVSAYKNKIMVWMFYWPFSAIWTILDHPIKKIFIFVFNRIRKKLQEMSDKIFAPLIKQRQEEDKRRAGE
jgi:hypothetical protein